MTITAQKSIPNVLADHIANHSRPLSLSEIMEDLNLTGANRTTVYRWLNQAREQNLVELIGDKKAARWAASAEMRKRALRSHLDQPWEKRPRVTYNEGFLEDYTPNKTPYLSQVQRDRLHAQCAPGTAAFSTLNQHDQSLFLCGLSYASSSMEGNPYDLAATEKLLIEGLEKDGASDTETTMVLNHHEAIRYLVENTHYPAEKNDVTVSMRDIKSIHGLLSAYLLKNPMMCGNIRNDAVSIKYSSYIPLSIHDSIKQALQLTMEKANAIEDPFEQSFFLLVHLPYLQPFEDCNKRTARVSCNIPLLRNGVAPMSWMDVNNEAFVDGLLGVYEKNNTSMLAEVFMDGYIRSTERFDIMRRNATPDATLVRYRKEVRATARQIILYGDTETPAEVAEKDRPSFHALVQKELSNARAKNPSSMVQLRIEEGDVDSWLSRETNQSHPRERMRA